MIFLLFVLFGYHMAISGYPLWAGTAVMALAVVGLILGEEVGDVLTRRLR